MSNKIIVPDDTPEGFTEIGLMGHDSGKVSDGWHTFDELYHYRALYNAGFLNELYVVVEDMKEDWHIEKSYFEHDGSKCFGKDDYFVVTCVLPTGQISNHYHGYYWHIFQIPAVDRAIKWDGHTPAQAAERLEKYLRGDF